MIDDTRFALPGACRQSFLVGTRYEMIEKMLQAYVKRIMYIYKRIIHTNLDGRSLCFEQPLIGPSLL